MACRPPARGEWSPICSLTITGITSTTYRAYPITDHIADKVCAMIEIHHRSDRQPQSSTRYHDLADLATFARTTVVDAHALTRALRSEADRRGLQLPDKLTIPDPTPQRRQNRNVPGTHAASTPSGALAPSAGAPCPSGLTRNRLGTSSRRAEITCVPTDVAASQEPGSRCSATGSTGHSRSAETNR
ncbi:MAG: nucleotidyl transferase AbiEii/AbiGii toxin family protein [Pseudonocardiaceae bacterium]